jgi:DNA-binding transcriptional MerR regulator
LEPERTPSGYRKFFSGQVERLWWILDQQRDGYVPLKEIRQRLAAAEASGVLSPLSAPPSAPLDPSASVHRLEPRSSALVAPIPLNRLGSGASKGGDVEEPDHDQDHDHDESHDPSLRHAPKEALGESRHPSSVARRVQHAFAAMTGDETLSATETPPRSPVVSASSRRAAPTGAASTGAASTGAASSGSTSTRRGAALTRSEPKPSDGSGERTSAAAGVAVPPPVPTPDRAGQAFGSSNPLIGQYTGASFTFEELVRASGLEPDELRQLESFGLLAGHQVLGATYYDEDALLAARAAHGFKQFGIEPRHMRIYRTMADRESGFLEQIVSPLVHRRQQAARTVAADQLEELIELGTQLRLVALRRLLRSSLDGR